MSALANHAYAKMNGIGNEIVVVDLRDRPGAVTSADARAVASQVAYDQLMVLHVWLKTASGWRLAAHQTTKLN